MSLANSSSLAFSAMVRTMKPPGSLSGTSCCSFSRNCTRSASLSMRCEMPMCFSCGR